MGFILYMAIFLYSVNVMRSVIDEKQTRIIEVLVSSLKPFELMLGKVIGVGGVGLFQMAIWGISAFALVSYGTGALRRPAHLPATGGARSSCPSSASGRC